MTPDQLAALRRIAEAAVAAERETGCPAEISAAQCIVESAWLQVAPGNNCFGVKAMGIAQMRCSTTGGESPLYNLMEVTTSGTKRRQTYLPPGRG